MYIFYSSQVLLKIKYFMFVNGRVTICNLQSRRAKIIYRPRKGLSFTLRRNLLGDANAMRPLRTPTITIVFRRIRG